MFVNDRWDSLVITATGYKFFDWKTTSVSRWNTGHWRPDAYQSSSYNVETEDPWLRVVLLRHTDYFMKCVSLAWNSIETIAISEPYFLSFVTYICYCCFEEFKFWRVPDNQRLFY